MEQAPLSPLTHPDKHQKKVLRVYILFLASLALSLVPNAMLALVSGCLMLAVLFMAYILRNDAEEGSLLENHMTFIIRTIWIGSLLAIVTMAVAAAYLFQMIDNSPLQPCVDKMFSMGLSPSTDPTIMMNVVEQCWGGYWSANMRIFIISGAIAAVPILLYFFTRFTRGFTRARGGYRIAKPKAWF